MAGVVYINVLAAAGKLGVSESWLRRQLQWYAKRDPKPPKRSKRGYNWQALQKWWLSAEKAGFKRQTAAGKKRGRRAAGEDSASVEDARKSQMDLRSQKLQIEIDTMRGELIAKVNHLEELEAHAHLVIGAIENWRQCVAAEFREPRIMELADRSIRNLRRDLADRIDRCREPKTKTES
jgi:hypothetical protein